MSLPSYAQFDTSATATGLALAMGIPADMIISAALRSVGGAAADPHGAAVHTGKLGNFAPREGNTFAVLTSCDIGLISGSNTASGASYDQNVTDGKGAEAGGDDVVMLQLVLNPPDTALSFSFDFVFASEEYPEYVGSPFNDFFVLEKDGSKITYDTSGGAAKVVTPFNVVVDQKGQTISVNANFFKENPDQNTGTQFDGWTPILTTCAPLLGTDSLVLNFAIGDVGDAILMSGIYLDNFKFDAHAATAVTFNPLSQALLGEVAQKKLDVTAYPNPFLPGSGMEMTFALSASACFLLGTGNGIKKIEIFNIAGRRIAVIIGNNAELLTWNGRNNQGELVAGGNYYYLATANTGKTGTGRFTLVK